jgi:multisubunit Na+/H+ antiporter MnhB subunit
VNDVNPQTGRLALGVAAITVVLAATIGAMRVVDRFLEHRDPQRAITALVVLWVARTALVEILLLLIQGVGDRDPFRETLLEAVESAP